MPKAPTPRCVFVRHGQTEWSKSGQYTSVTDLPLTDFGEEQMSRTGELIFSSKFINPDHLTYIFVSPRLRAQQTLQLVLKSLPQEVQAKIKIITDNDVREWDYGDYEGLLTKQIKQLRSDRGLDRDRDWLIWRDGCENGESSQQVGLRLSRLINRIQNLHLKAFQQDVPSDIMVFAHGHILRYFAALWFKLGVEESVDGMPAYSKSYKFTRGEEEHLKQDLTTYRYLDNNPNFLLEAGGVGVLSYAHHDINEPALSLCGSFVLPPDESAD